MDHDGKLRAPQIDSSRAASIGQSMAAGWRLFYWVGASASPNKVLRFALDDSDAGRCVPEVNAVFRHAGRSIYAE